MNSLNAFNYDDNDNKKSNKSLFDLMNELMMYPMMLILMIV